MNKVNCCDSLLTNTVLLKNNRRLLYPSMHGKVIYLCLCFKKFRLSIRSYLLYIQKLPSFNSTFALYDIRVYNYNSKRTFAVRIPLREHLSIRDIPRSARSLAFYFLSFQPNFLRYTTFRKLVVTGSIRLSVKNTTVN